MNAYATAAPARTRGTDRRPWFHPEFGPEPGAGALPEGLIEAVRARVPRRRCAHCGESIGAARLTLHPEATACAWCAAPLRAR